MLKTSTNDHRQFPTPSLPWVMTQTWNHVLFAHWSFPEQEVQRLLPPELQLDTFDGRAWVGVVPFSMTDVRPRFTPNLPGVSAFLELNVRTYVTMNGKPGVYFFSLDAENPLAVMAARMAFNLPYFSASMRLERRGEHLHYRSRRTHGHAPEASLDVTYRPLGDVYEAALDSIDSWLTDRYCLYAINHFGKPFRLQIDHPPWKLQTAEAEFHGNTMLPAIGLRVPSEPPLLHYSRRVKTVEWLAERI